jgi:signal transduction histidine kinase
MRLNIFSRLSARLRLTLIYAASFVLAGGLLLTFNYVLMQQRFEHTNSAEHARADATPLTSPKALPEQTHLRPALEQNSREIRAEALRQLRVQSGIALAAMAALSAGLGWLMAGRVLKPLHQITATARRMSESRLNQRIALQGPQDEFKELADTFDEMLARLDVAFESQKRFVANASHELRTPLSIMRAELDVTLSNPEVTPAELQQMADVVRGAIERSERLIESLLLMARSESGLPERHPIDLAEVTRDVLGHFAAPADSRGVALREDLSPALVAGDAPLLEHLARNLVENALAYNHEGGWIEVSTRQSQDVAELVVTNSGPVVPAESIDALFQPFRRAASDRTTSSGSVGLGLSIVRAVARAHGGDVAAQPRTDGGLEVVVRLPTIERHSSLAIDARVR